MKLYRDIDIDIDIDLKTDIDIDIDINIRTTNTFWSENLAIFTTTQQSIQVIQQYQWSSNKIYIIGNEDTYC